MKNFTKYLKEQTKFFKKHKIALSTLLMCAATTVPAFAEPATLQFNFSPTEMFTWTNTMLSALMPVLYITLGISLAFIIINALKYAFR